MSTFQIFTDRQKPFIYMQTEHSFSFKTCPFLNHGNCTFMQQTFYCHDNHQKLPTMKTFHLHCRRGGGHSSAQINEDMNNTWWRRRQEQCRLEDWLITTYSATVLDELKNSESKNRICRYTSRHEDMWGSAMKLQPFLTTDLDKAGNQLHTQATLLSTRKPYTGRPSGSQSRSGRRSKDSPRPGAPSRSLSLQQSV